MRHFPRGQNRSQWAQWRYKLCTEILRKEENCVSCTNTILNSAVSRNGFPFEKSLNRQWTRFVQKHRPSKTSILCSVYFASECLLRLDLAGHDSKGDTVRRRLIEGAVSTNANNSTTKSRILKSPFRGGRSSKEVLAVGNNGGGKISCCFFGDILKLFWNSQSLCCLLWRARVFCTTIDVTRSQTLVSCFSRYRPYFYPIKRNVPMLEQSSFFVWQWCKIIQI